MLAGLGSRESGWGLALTPPGPGGTGDFAKRAFPTQFRTGPLPTDGGGFGRGLIQIDFDAHPFARGEGWKDPAQNIAYGSLVLAQSRDWIRAKAGLSGTALLQAALAAYNCGPGNALRALREGKDVDCYTAGHDYGRDTLSRAGFFQRHGWS